MKTATKIKTLTNWTADAAVYRLSEPYEDESFIIASAVNVPGSGPETYLFPANEDGTAKRMSEMPASMRGVLSHATVLAEAGYTIVPEPVPA